MTEHTKMCLLHFTSQGFIVSLLAEKAETSDK